MSTRADEIDLRGRGMREHVAQGTLVNAGFLVGLSVLGLFRGFVLAALVTAAEFGVWTILVVSLGALVLLKQAAIGDRFVQQDEPDQQLAFQKAFTLETIVNAVLFVICLGLVPLIAAIYDQHELIAPGLALALLLPAGAFQAPLWVYYRRLQYLRQRVLQAIEPVVTFLVSLVLAIAGLGEWALVLGILAGAWVQAAVLAVLSPYPLRLRFDRATARGYAGFSGPLLLVGVAGVATSTAATLVGEEAAGLAGAGAIGLAVSVSLFADRVDQVVTGTLYPAICAVQDRTELLFESFVKSNRLALMWAVPFGAGLGLFAGDLVDLLGRERWAAAEPLLAAFGWTAAVAHLGFNWTAYFRARGDTRPIGAAALLSIVVFVGVAAALVGSQGLDAIVWAVVANAATQLVLRAFFLTNLFDGFGMLRHAVRGLAPAVPAILAVVLLRAADSGDRSTATAIAELLLFIAVAVAATVAAERPLLREALGYLRGRRTPARL